MDLRQEATELRREPTGTALTSLATQVPTQFPEVTQDKQSSRASFPFSVRPGLYAAILLAVAVLAGLYSLRTYGIFGCPASGYTDNHYLGYCGAASYGDYDHGAFWFDLEPAATKAAANASVLFIGSSRTTFAFSSKATSDWFTSLSETYYLLGFTHFENYTFESPLLRKLHPRPKVYVINIDSFFDPSQTGPGKTVMEDGAAKARYEEKRRWQAIHKAICGPLSPICGDNLAIFRSRSTGSWQLLGKGLISEPVSYDDHVNKDTVTSYANLGREFLHDFSADPACTILTIVPKVKTEIATAQAIGPALDVNFVAPRLNGLVTFDGVHLNGESAQRWSSAFLEQAGPQIRRCLSE